MLLKQITHPSSPLGFGLDLDFGPYLFVLLISREFSPKKMADAYVIMLGWGSRL